MSYVLNRSRSEVALPEIGVNAGSNSLSLRFADNWLDEHPLTRADLDAEVEYLQAIDFKLKFS